MDKDLQTKEQQRNTALQNTYLTFYINGTLCSFPLANVLEIIDVQPITRIPGTPPYVKGIINLRGGIVPLIDLRLKLGKKEKTYDDVTSVIVTTYNEYTVGMIVDEVCNVVRAEEVTLTTLPEFDTVNANDYLSSVAKCGDDLIMNLDCETLLQDDAKIND